MLSLPFQTIIPFILTAIVIIIVTVIAEKYGTKTGGIFGTIPSTIVIAYIFIALNKSPEFASNAIAVVPAVIGVNIFYSFILVLLISRSIYYAFTGSLAVWAILSFILWYTNMENIYISVSIFFISMIVSFLALEKIKKIKSIGKVNVHYTFTKIVLRGMLAGTIISISVLLSNIGEVISGIFSVFPVIVTSAVVISYYEHGPDFAAGIVKSMIIGSTSVIGYAVAIHFLYPIYGIIWGSIIAFAISLIIAIFNLKLLRKIT
jgi:hypothetical protein